MQSAVSVASAISCVCRQCNQLCVSPVQSAVSVASAMDGGKFVVCGATVSATVSAVQESMW